MPCVRTLICSTDVVRLCAEFVQLSLCDQFTFCSCVFMTCISLGTLLEDLCDELWYSVWRFDLRLCLCKLLLMLNT